jgi:hypothetical protein
MQLQNQQAHFPQTGSNLGHHPKIRASATKPPTQLKNKSVVQSNAASGAGMIYSTKDSGNNSKLARAYASNQDADGGYNSNSFLEESYIRNATNNF